MRSVSGDDDSLVGMMRAAMPLEALKVVERVLMIDEALCEKASRYVETFSFYVRGQEFSSFTFSYGFDQVVLKSGVF